MGVLRNGDEAVSSRLSAPTPATTAAAQRSRLPVPGNSARTQDLAAVPPGPSWEGRRPGAGVGSALSPAGGLEGTTDGSSQWGQMTVWPALISGALRGRWQCGQEK